MKGLYWLTVGVRKVQHGREGKDAGYGDGISHYIQSQDAEI